MQICKNLPLFHLLLSNPPSPQWQTLQLQSFRLNKAPKSDYANDDAEHVYNVIAIGGDIASTASVNTDMAVIFKSAGKGGGDEVAFEVRGWDGRGCAGC